jgi:hypothetical protein
MDANFHYYVTYTAAHEAGFTDADAVIIAQAARYVDENLDAACPSFQNVSELVMGNMDLLNSKENIRKILEIWPVYHFLPGDFGKMSEDMKFDSAVNENLYRIICGTGGPLARVITDEAYTFANNNTLANNRFNETALHRIGITMHVLADTFAHQRFAGYPEARINNVSTVRLTGMEDRFGLDKASWSPIPGKDVEMFGKKMYAYSFTGPSNQSFGYLGHGRIGHIPDIPNMVFGYKPNWSNDKPDEGDFVYQSNPLEFQCAYEQMILAMRFINNDPRTPNFVYVDREAVLHRYHVGAGEPQGVMRLFSEMKDDSELPAIWRRQMYCNAPAYQQPANKQSFVVAAYDHKQVVFRYPRLASLISEYT